MLAAAVVRHRALIALCMVLGALAGWVVGARSTEFEASTKLLLRTSGPEIQLLAGQTGDLGTSERDVANGAELLRSRTTATAAAERLGLSADEADTVADAVEIVAEREADVITVTASAPARGQAASIANAYVRAFEELQSAQQAERAATARRVLTERLQTLRPAAQRGLEGQNLRARITQLRALEAVGTGGPQVIEGAEASQARKSGGRSPLTAAIGALLGLGFGFAVALLRHQSDRRLRSSADFEEAFGTRVLASVPVSASLERNQPFGKLDPGDAEAFRMVAAKLRAPRDAGPVRSLLITSSREGEGKTTLAWYLAAAAAAGGLDVALVEADLRRPELAQRHGLDADRGLADVLEGELPAAEATQRVQLGAEGSPGATGFDVLVCGPTPSTPPALQAARLVEIGDELRERYDLVVIDTAPITQVADTVALVRAADSVVIAGRAGLTDREDAARIRRELTDLGARIVGLVVNGAEADQRYAAYADDPRKVTGLRRLGVRRPRLSTLVAGALALAAVAGAVWATAGEEAAQDPPADAGGSVPTCREITTAEQTPAGTCRTASALLSLSDAPDPVVLPSLELRLLDADVLRPSTARARRRGRARVTTRVQVVNRQADQPLRLTGDGETQVYLAVDGSRVRPDPAAAELPGALRVDAAIPPGGSRTGTLRFELEGETTQRLDESGRAQLAVLRPAEAGQELTRIGVVRFQVP